MGINWIRKLFKRKKPFNADFCDNLSLLTYDELCLLLKDQFKLTINRNVENKTKFIANWESSTSTLSILYDNDGSFIQILYQDWK
jgi:hypothetical protein